MFKLRLKNNSYPDGIEFKTATEFYNFLNNQYKQSIEEQWQWYDAGEWKCFSEFYIRGDKKKLWFV